MFDPFGPIERI